MCLHQIAVHMSINLLNRVVKGLLLDLPFSVNDCDLSTSYTLGSQYPNRGGGLGTQTSSGKICSGNESLKGVLVSEFG